jgi:uncharacterized protein YydD (DUF2326 family)
MEMNNWSAAMFLHELGSTDKRFKKLVFHEGMNILVADKTAESTSGDSRNGAGKTSFVRLLRYLLGLDLDDCLKAQEIAEHEFWAKLSLDRMTSSITLVERPVTPRTKVIVNGSTLHPMDWKYQLGKCFQLPEDVSRPTVGQLFGQLIRNYFLDAVKTHAVESDWECGVRLGYFLGISPEILGKAGEIIALDKHRKNLKKAITDGALPGVSLNEPELRAQLAQARSRRSKLEENLQGFRVDEQYAEHQNEADRLSKEIRNLNDEALIHEQRKRDIETAIKDEQLPVDSEMNQELQLKALYEEVGVVLPDAVRQRFEDVSAFHKSVVKNRQHFLKSELQELEKRLVAIKENRQKLDVERSNIMKLLSETMALETFRSAEKELTELDVLVADLERRLVITQSITSSNLQLKAKMAEAESDVHAEIAERTRPLEDTIALFTQLGEEIYNDRQVSLLIDVTNKGVLKVNPRIDGDASTGISEVKTFLLDLACIVAASKAGNAPRILVHDSLLFDSMDDRQMASCLSIGARLAQEYEFQYIVTLNSDRLSAAENEGFDRVDFVIDPVLTDSSESGGLFGFRFA